MKAIKERRWHEMNLAPRTRALCELAEKLSGTPTRMTEDDWKPLRDLGFDDEGLLEVAHIVGLFNYLTRLADGFGLQLDEATVHAGQTGIPLKRNVRREGDAGGMAGSSHQAARAE